MFLSIYQTCRLKGVSFLKFLRAPAGSTSMLSSTRSAVRSNGVLPADSTSFHSGLREILTPVEFGEE